MHKFLLRQKISIRGEKASPLICQNHEKTKIHIKGKNKRGYKTHKWKRAIVQNHNDKNLIQLIFL